MKYQGLYNLIFSNDRSSRWKRHFLFWLAVFFYHLVRISMIYVPEKLWESRWSLLEMTFYWGVIINILFTYTIIYYLVPRYFHKRKYFYFTVSVLLLFFFLLSINYMHQWVVNRKFTSAAGMFTPDFVPILRGQLIRFFGNPPLIFGLFLSLKTLRNWHLGQLKAETLEKENANAELQLLKAQVHPHFLFNTLNNIYSFSLYRLPQAGTMVKKLSGMLGYMINECDEKLVSLEKELSLVKDYMGLEKVRYGNRLDMQVEIHGDFENKMIAPLLMIPFIENSFKHGTSQMLRHPWIKLEITTIKDQLFFKLSNSKPAIVPSNVHSKGIGLLNVKKRLELLYPGKYQLDISVTEEMFTVNLQLLVDEYEFANKKVDIANAAFAYT